MDKEQDIKELMRILEKCSAKADTDSRYEYARKSLTKILG